MEAEAHILRRAHLSDRDQILDFLRDHWNEDHVFVRHPELFDYHHVDGENVNFFIAVEKSKGRIDAVLGYVQYSKETPADVCLALWKALRSGGDPMLGMRLLQALRDTLQPRTLSCCGINEKTIPIYHYLGYETGVLRQYFMLNERLSEYRIARVPLEYAAPALPRASGAARLVEIPAAEEMVDLLAPNRCPDCPEHAPRKDAAYIRKRYFEHPVYLYHVYGIERADGCASVLFTREVHCRQSRVLRIVDFIGDEEDIRLAGGALSDLLHGKGYEYIDFYLYGIENAVLVDAGFTLNDNLDELVIPNYFEPFEQRNVEINFFSSQMDHFTMFKADGDQDRPNLIPATGGQVQ